MIEIAVSTEFTNLFEIEYEIKLISAGFVAPDGREFYFELTDHYKESECAAFLLEAILPHLDHAKHGMNAPVAASKLKAWIESFEEPVRIATGAPAFDMFLVHDLLVDNNCWPHNIDERVLNVDVSTVHQLIKQYFANDPMAIRHHALWEARALSCAIKEICG